MISLFVIYSTHELSINYTELLYSYWIKLAKLMSLLSPLTPLSNSFKAVSTATEDDESVKVKNSLRV